MTNKSAHGGRCFVSVPHSLGGVVSEANVFLAGRARFRVAEETVEPEITDLVATRRCDEVRFEIIAEGSLQDLLVVEQLL